MVVGASTHDPRITIRHSIDRSTCQGFNACHAGVHVQSQRKKKVERNHLDDAIGDVNKGGSHVDICNLKMNAEVVVFVITFIAFNTFIVGVPVTLRTSQYLHSIVG